MRLENVLRVQLCCGRVSTRLCRLDLRNNLHYDSIFKRADFPM